jgi:SAM-dependent methyltransferase/uncharacterized protein YbaR (Trm112 family)
VLDPWYLDNLACPVDGSRLELRDGGLVSEAGRRYPVVDGVPVMLRDNVEQTLWVAEASLRQAGSGPEHDDVLAGYYVDSLGVSPEERERIVELIRDGSSPIDPVVMYIIVHTSGSTYQHLLGHIDQYPIPDLRLPPARAGERLLDVGCNWGRWCVAAGRRGYAPVGLDPSLGAIMAARRVCRQLGVEARFVVGDARHLPFVDECFDVVHSYSVLQHFSKGDARQAIGSAGRTLKPGGTCLIQMANFLGIRSLQMQARRRFAEPKGFEVRYWSVPELRRTFRERIGPTEVSVDCYFGLGLQASDLDLMTPPLRALVRVSEGLRLLSRVFPPLKYVADSVYLRSTRARTPG